MKIFRVVLKIITVLLVIFLLLVLRFFMSGDYRIKLMNGYSLVRVYANAVLLTNDKSGVLINENIEKYSLSGSIITGIVSDGGLDEFHKKQSRPGYFIVDMDKNTILQGLDEQEWKNELKKRGIISIKKFYKPSRYDNLLMRLRS